MKWHHYGKVWMQGIQVRSENEIRSMRQPERARVAKSDQGIARIFTGLTNVPKMDTASPFKVKLVVTHYRVRSLDDDNLIGGFKSYRDGLKARRPKLPKGVKVKFPPDGWIFEDSRKWLEVEHKEILVPASQAGIMIDFYCPAENA